MRNNALKGMVNSKNTRTSPLMKKGFDFSKGKKDYSAKGTKGNWGSKIADAVTPKNTPGGILGAVIPVNKAVKVGKFLKNLVT